MHSEVLSQKQKQGAKEMAQLLKRVLTAILEDLGYISTHNHIKLQF